MAESENWQYNKSALQCHKYMLEHSIATDVTFVVSNKINGTPGDGQISRKGKKVETIKAHKYQLICRSPVFYAMLCGDLAETGEIIVDDIDPEVFRQMLNYIYTDDVDMKPEVAMHILYASKKYLIPGLTQLCVDYLAKELSRNNACILYDHSLLFDEKELSERSLALIKSQTKVCFEAPSLMYVRQSTLSHILDSEWFTATEVEIFTACEKWARGQLEHSEEVTGEAMRTVLGECVTKIRYPTMTIEEFGANVASTGILPANEEIAIFRFLSTKGKVVLSPHEFKSQNRYLKGPFRLVYDGDCVQTGTQGVRTQFYITCNQRISVKEFILGDIRPGPRSTNDFTTMECKLTTGKVCFDQACCNVQSFQSGKLSLATNIVLKENSRHQLEITLQTNIAGGYNTIQHPSIQSLQTNIAGGYNTIQLPSIQCATAKEYQVKDEKTDLKLTVTSNNHMFLLGLVYDYV